MMKHDYFPKLLGPVQVIAQPVEHIIGGSTVGCVQRRVTIQHHKMCIPIVERVVALLVARA
ncbi:MAG: hypothetical protein DMG06_17095 [Acidobacteria bacterium]|nr:MAG: hypothetical protein DMG06_17095 [Acidobacteriota bacterium]